MTASNQLIQEFQEIHERIFELACRKSKYAPKMSDALNKAIETALEHEYETYYELYKEKLDAAVAIDLYIFKAKFNTMVPRHWRHWWSFWKDHSNTAADLADAQIAQDAHLYYEELMEHLETLKTSFRERNSEKNAEIADRAAAQLSEPEDPPIEHDGNAPRAAAQPSEPEGSIKEHAENAPRAGEVPQTSEPVKPAQEPAEAWEEENHDAIPDENIPSPS